MLKLMSVVLIAAVAPMAQAYDQNQASLVDSWYVRYLGRHGEPAGIADHSEKLCVGVPADVVEAGILVSDEYYHRNGCNDALFIAAMYRDVAGINASPHQVNRGVHILRQFGDRQMFVVEFLRTVRGSNVAPAAVQSYRPSFQAYSPNVVPAPVYRQGFPGYASHGGYSAGYRQPPTGYSVGYRQAPLPFGIR